MTSLILHLSDIHFESDSDPIINRAQKIASCIYKYLPNIDSIFIVVSGDIASAKAILETHFGSDVAIVPV